MAHLPNLFLGPEEILTVAQNKNKKKGKIFFKYFSEIFFLHHKNCVYSLKLPHPGNSTELELPLSRINFHGP